MDIEKLSGLELLQQVRSGKLPHPTMADTIPMKVIEIDKGTATFEAQADRRHLNPMGGVHGGFAATVLDSVTGCAVHTMLGPGETYGTVDLNVKMVKPVPRNTLLRAKGTVIHMSGRLGISEATLVDDKGTVYAHATCTCMIIRKSRPDRPIALKTIDQNGEETVAKLKIV